MSDLRLSRRSVTGGLGAAVLASPLVAPASRAQDGLRKRPIPHGDGEMLPVVGLGTAGVFNRVAGGQERSGPTAMIRALVEGGASLIDTAPDADACPTPGNAPAWSGISNLWVEARCARLRP
jgi:hypothetical protein